MFPSNSLSNDENYQSFRAKLAALFVAESQLAGLDQIRNDFKLVELASKEVPTAHTCLCVWLEGDTYHAEFAGKVHTRSAAPVSNPLEDPYQFKIFRDHIALLTQSDDAIQTQLPALDDLFAGFQIVAAAARKLRKPNTKLSVWLDHATGVTKAEINGKKYEAPDLPAALRKALGV
jgi:hypothetical protein